jgi:uncharacterized protein (TIGR02246 family)
MSYKLIDWSLGVTARRVWRNDMDAEGEVRALYQALLEAWNRRDAKAFAGLLAEESSVIGFDGSQMEGPVEVEGALGQIFKDHPTAAYVSIVRGVRFLTPDVAVLRAVAGMVPPGQNDIKPEVNTVQSLVAVRQEGKWRIALFQNTPAAFHGRPEESERLSEELRGVLQEKV